MYRRRSAVSYNLLAPIFTLRSSPRKRRLSIVPHETLSILAASWRSTSRGGDEFSELFATRHPPALGEFIQRSRQYPHRSPERNARQCAACQQSADRHLRHRQPFRRGPDRHGDRGRFDFVAFHVSIPRGGRPIAAARKTGAQCSCATRLHSCITPLCLVISRVFPQCASRAFVQVRCTAQSSANAESPRPARSGGCRTFAGPPGSRLAQAPPGHRPRSRGLLNKRIGCGPAGYCVRCALLRPRALLFRCEPSTRAIFQPECFSVESARLPLARGS